MAVPARGTSLRRRANARAGLDGMSQTAHRFYVALFKKMTWTEFCSEHLVNVQLDT